MTQTGLHIQLMLSFRNHRKVKRVARELGLTMRDARGLLVTLWLEVLDQAPDGILEGWEDDDIANAAEWTEDPRQLVAALEKAQLIHWDLDGPDLPVPIINDWSEYCGLTRIQEKRAKDRERKRKSRAVKNGHCDVTVTSTGRPHTSQNVTPETRRDETIREETNPTTPLSDNLTEPVPWDSWISGFWKVVSDFWPKALMGNPRTAFEALVANRDLWGRVKADGLDWLVTIFRNMDASWKATSWPLDKYPLIANVFRSQSEHWMRHTPEARAVSANASAAKWQCTVNGCAEYRHGETDLCTDHFLEADR